MIYNQVISNITYYFIIFMYITVLYNKYNYLSYTINHKLNKTIICLENYISFNNSEIEGYREILDLKLLELNCITFLPIAIRE